MSDYLHVLEQQSIHVIREAYARLKPLAMLWSLGEGSNALLWLARKAFLGRVPFPVVLLDTGNEFPEVYAFRDRLLAEWDLDYVDAACPPIEATDATLPPAARAAARKTLGLKTIIAERGFRGILLGLCRDQQPIRGKERVFSPRRPDGSWDFHDQPAEFWDHYQTDFPADLHVRVHPLLAWTELDIWRYVERERIPVCGLYFARDGKRYRSLGEPGITFPIESDAATIPAIIAELEQTRQGEHAGRAMDHEREDTMPGWYRGPSLVAALEALAEVTPQHALPLRMSVQDVYGQGEQRVVAGRVDSGRLAVGDALVFSPSGRAGKVAELLAWPEPAPDAVEAGDNASIVLDRPLVVERGDMASHREHAPKLTAVFDAKIFWLSAVPLVPGRDLTMQMGPGSAAVRVQAIRYRIDVATLAPEPANAIAAGEIASVTLRAHELIAIDDFAAMPATGRFVLRDGYVTVGGGIADASGYPDHRAMPEGARNLTPIRHQVTEPERASRFGHAGAVIWLTGLSAAGKSTLAMALERRLFDGGYATFVLDGDNVRRGLNANLGFSPEDRQENIRRVGEAAALFAEAGFICITAFISPYRDDRRRARAAVAKGHFLEIYVKADLAACEARDPKGLYRRAREGKLKDFTGIDSPYEEPEAPDLVVDTTRQDIAACVENLVAFVAANCRV